MGGWKDSLSHVQQSLFPKITTTSLVQHYAPLSGAISHTLFSVHIFSPSLVTKVFPVYDLAVSNTVLFNSHVGIGLYVYFRPHLFGLNSWDRVEASVFASVIFNFGSLLFAVLLKAVLPKTLATTPRTIMGASLSLFLMSRGLKYLRHIDGASPLNSAITELASSKQSTKA